MIVGQRTTPAIAGTWRSDRGSLLRIEAADTGELTGTLTSAVGQVGGPERLRGFVVGPAASTMAVGFVVRWQAAGSIAAWSGRVRDGEMHLMWLLTSEEPEREPWKATLIGHDVFRRDYGSSEPL